MVGFEDERFQYEAIEVPLAICDSKIKTHYFRVLPADILPHHIFATQGRETASKKYLERTAGLRQVVKSFQGDIPHFSTLHGWLGGLGHFARDRDKKSNSPTLSKIVAETSRRLNADLNDPWQAPVKIYPVHYQSEKRRDELTAAARLFAVAAIVAPGTRFSLTQWLGLILVWLPLVTISWLARSKKMDFQLRPRPKGRLGSRKIRKPKNKEPP
jgi:hypothetical protein